MVCQEIFITCDAIIKLKDLLESRLQEDEIDLLEEDELSLLKREIAQLKEEAKKKDDKITDLENQLKQARALIGNGFIACDFN
jgi:hypothetical protein